MVLGTVTAFCLFVLIIGLIAGVIVCAIGGIGTLLVIGFELGCYLLPVILLYIVGKTIWRMTTEKKNNTETTEKTE